MYPAWHTCVCIWYLWLLCVVRFVCMDQSSINLSMNLHASQRIACATGYLHTQTLSHTRTYTTLLSYSADGTSSWILPEIPETTPVSTPGNASISSSLYWDINIGYVRCGSLYTWQRCDHYPSTPLLLLCYYFTTTNCLTLLFLLFLQATFLLNPLTRSIFFGQQ